MLLSHCERWSSPGGAGIACPIGSLKTEVQQSRPKNRPRRCPPSPHSRQRATVLFAWTISDRDREQYYGRDHDHVHNRHHGHGHAHNRDPRHRLHPLLVRE